VLGVSDVLGEMRKGLHCGYHSHREIHTSVKCRRLARSSEQIEIGNSNDALLEPEQLAGQVDVTSLLTEPSSRLADRRLRGSGFGHIRGGEIVDLECAREVEALDSQDTGRHDGASCEGSANVH
jgi:hypothetical protein